MARKYSLFNVKIDPEFEALIEAPTEEEYNQLKENIREHGLLDRILVWREPGTDCDLIVDGHNRFRILNELSETGEFFIDDSCFQSVIFLNRDDVKEYMIKNQLGRRNLTPFQRTELALKLKPIIAEKAKKNQSTHTAEGYQGLENSSKAVDTRQEIATAAQVSTDTVRKVEKILEKASGEDKNNLRKGKTSINRVFKMVSGNDKEEQPSQPEKVLKLVRESGNKPKEPLTWKNPNYQKEYESNDSYTESFIANVPEEKQKEFTEIAEVHMQRLCMASNFLKMKDESADPETLKTLSHYVADAMWYFHKIYGVPLGAVNIFRTKEGLSEAVLNDIE